MFGSVRDVPLNLYCSLPPDLSVTPCVSSPGSTVWRTKLKAKYARRTPVTLKLPSPRMPSAGHPVSSLSVARVRLLGCKADGTGQPETSLHRKAKR